MADAGQLLSLLSLERSVQTCSSLHYHQLQHGKHMPRSSSKAVPACNETLAFRIGLLAGDMERLGLNADAAILRGLMRSLPDQPPSCDDRVEKSDTLGAPYQQVLHRKNMAAARPGRLLRGRGGTKESQPHLPLFRCPNAAR